MSVKIWRWRKIASFAVCSLLLGSGHFAPVFGNPIAPAESSHSPTGLQQTDIARSARILYIGDPQTALAVSSGGTPLSIGRAGDLEGLPVKLVMRPGAQARTFTGGAQGGSARRDLQVPASSGRVTSGYGVRWDPLGAGWRSHAGVDLAAAFGSPVAASGNGIVAAARWQGGYGLLVTLDHGGGVETRYGHLSRLSVYEGQQVKKGDVVGFVGSTGRSTGAHLHYEVRENGRAVDPLPNGRK